jgi:hypothetical protein
VKMAKSFALWSLAPYEAYWADTVPGRLIFQRHEETEYVYEKTFGPSVIEKDPLIEAPCSPRSTAVRQNLRG